MRTTELLRSRVGLQGSAHPTLTLPQAAAKADSVGLDYLHGFSKQTVNPSIAKNSIRVSVRKSLLP